MADRAAIDAPRVLFLSPVVPAPLDRGQNVRIHHLVTGLAQRFRVTLVVPEDRGLEEPSPLWSAVERLVPVPAGQPATARSTLALLARQGVLARPAQAARLRSYREVVDRLPLDGYAAVWVARAGLASVVRGLGRRVVVDLDDLEHLMAVRRLRLRSRRAEGGGGVLHQVFNLGQSFVREVVLARRYGACTVASPADVDHLRRWGVRNAALVPNGVLPAAGVGGSAPIRSGGPALRVVFVGNMAYPPNIDALTHFEDDVRPELDGLGLTVELSVVGPGATGELVARFPRVEFRGFAAQLGEELQSYDVSIVPLRLGGGTKLKVLDALAAGVPVVTTSVGAEGLQLESGVHALVADTPQDFAAALAALHADPARRRSLGANGRVLAEDRYSWSAVQSRAVEIVEALRA